MSLWKLFQGFIADLYTSLLDDFIAQLDAVFGNLLGASFYVEYVPGLEETFLTPFRVQKALASMYGFLLIILTVKILWKGYKVFILWRDGDAETNPIDLIQGGIIAIATAALFPTLYDIGFSVITTIINTISQSMFPTSAIEISGVLDVLRTVIGKTFSLMIFGMIYGILLMWLFFSMLRQGVEMLVFRMGIPVAVVGLVDSDGGVWKPYIQTIFRQYASAVIRYMCLLISSRLVFTTTFVGMIVGIVFLVVAIKTPAMLAQFLAPKTPGGGATQKAGIVISAVRLFGGI